MIAALLAILSTQHLEKLTEKTLTERIGAFLKKLLKE
jgi:hypothetical protein